MRILAALLLALPAALYGAEAPKPYVIPLIGLDGRIYALTITPLPGETRHALICFETPGDDLSCIVDDHGRAQRAMLSAGKELPPT